MTTENCIFEGRFGEIRTPDLLTFLDMLGKTGTLQVTRESVTKKVFWEVGEIVFAESTLPQEQVAEYLCVNGWVSPEALADARGEAASDEELVKVMIRQETLEPSVLPRALRTMVLEIVYSMFELEEGRFEFRVTPEPHDERVRLRTSVANIIMEGSRRLDEWRRIREAFSSDAVYPVPAPDDATDTEVKLPPMEQEILGFVDGRSTISEIIQKVDHDQFTTLEALLTLANAQLLSVSDTLVSPEPAETSDGGNGLSREERDTADKILGGFNNIFAGIHDTVTTVKGDEGRERFAATLQRRSFQTSDVFSGVEFLPDGRVPAADIIRNFARLPQEQRMQKLRGSLDRLLAQQVRQLDTSYDPDLKKAVSQLISEEKARLA